MNSKSEAVAYYLGPDSQNELISLTSDNILKEITNRTKSAEYYSIIFDCTQDISHQEQITMIIRFVELQKDKAEIKDSFDEVFKVADTSGAGLFELLLEKLASLGLDLMDCRYQSYNNGSNMKGKYSCVKARLL
ncbi:uncharacterized protein LOC106869182 [Octopus bimaculoides]|uniref:uncharacterized protein LOC106869182 n=1 Tax=Octopus bimaculoides TaxID=37653 RepID=UPI00071CC363|nr:uncharacterized protein LOC106869182 [Octopus bimaculoides]|eukprot:XP_014770292.1 PREDICTED: uncharacterized protein LOC106869182 [Octopus bimaculoides]